MVAHGRGHFKRCTGTRRPRAPAPPGPQRGHRPRAHLAPSPRGPRGRGPGARGLGQWPQRGVPHAHAQPVVGVRHQQFAAPTPVRIGHGLERERTTRQRHARLSPRRTRHCPDRQRSVRAPQQRQTTWPEAPRGQLEPGGLDGHALARTASIARACAPVVALAQPRVRCAPDQQSTPPARCEPPGAEPGGTEFGLERAPGERVLAVAQRTARATAAEPEPSRATHRPARRPAGADTEFHLVVGERVGGLERVVAGPRLGRRFVGTRAHSARERQYEQTRPPHAHERPRHASAIRTVSPSTG